MKIRKEWEPQLASGPQALESRMCKTRRGGLSVRRAEVMGAVLGNSVGLGIEVWWFPFSLGNKMQAHMLRQKGEDGKVGRVKRAGEVWSSHCREWNCLLAKEVQ